MDQLSLEKWRISRGFTDEFLKTFWLKKQDTVLGYYGQMYDSAFAFALPGPLLPFSPRCLKFSDIDYPSITILPPQSISQALKTMAIDRSATVQWCQRGATPKKTNRQMRYLNEKFPFYGTRIHYNHRFNDYKQMISTFYFDYLIRIRDNCQFQYSRGEKVEMAGEVDESLMDFSWIEDEGFKKSLEIFDEKWGGFPNSCCRYSNEILALVSDARLTGRIRAPETALKYIREGCRLMDIKYWNNQPVSTWFKSTKASPSKNI